MKRNPVAHLLLALLILFQSVSVLSDVPLALMTIPMTSTVISDTSTDAATDLRRTDAVKNCHGVNPLNAGDSPRACCVSMDDAECLLGCASIAAALPGVLILDSIDPHIRHLIQATSVAQQEIPSRLFRPPRAS